MTPTEDDRAAYIRELLDAAPPFEQHDPQAQQLILRFWGIERSISGASKSRR